MLKKIFFMSYLIISISHLYAMEAPCWFNNIPAEIIDLIAYFLPFDDIESEQEFIRRTTTMEVKTAPSNWLECLPSEYGKSSKSLIAHSPNNSIWALLFQPERSSNLPSALIMYNLTKDEQLYGEIYAHVTNYNTLAVSRNGNMFATLNKQLKLSSEDEPTAILRYENVLKIKNIITQETQLINIPNYFTINTTSKYVPVDFHKEETHIIIHGINHTISDTKNFMIFPLTVNTPPTNPDNKKTLQKYFAQRKICKEFSQQHL